MPDARFVRDWDEYMVEVNAATSIGEIFQLPTGEAAYYTGRKSGSSLQADAGVDEQIIFDTSGKVTVTKTTGIVILDGGRVYWDHSANSATYLKVNDRDFYIGRAVGDAASNAATLVVDLNKNPPYDIDLLRDGYLTVPVGTQVLGGFLPPQRQGGALAFILNATSEAQKLDALSRDRFAKNANAIAEFIFLVPSDGAGTVVDVSIGIANGTNATDASAIAERLFAHLDANVVDILFESADGITTVALVDSTKNYAEGSAVAQRVELWFDLRTNADIQCYVDGVLILPATVFRLDNATGPLGLLVHVEKTASTDTYELTVERACVRYAEQAA